MQVILFDEEKTWNNLLPLTFTRSVSDIRVGILTIREKWNRHLHTTCWVQTKDYLQQGDPFSSFTEGLCIPSGLCPDPALISALKDLKTGEALVQGQQLLGYHGTLEQRHQWSNLKAIPYDEHVLMMHQPWDIFTKNAEALLDDFELLTTGRTSETLSPSVTVIGDRSLVFLEKGAKAEACILNTHAGPVYLGEDAEIMEGSVVRGPFALCEHSALKLCTKIYGATTIGPHSKVGGEVNNSVIFGFSNKAHDGFLGNSVIGEWCNLGADTNNSNLKNNYGNVKLYHYPAKKAVDTGLQFCGLIMGDHSKSGINTMFNTGTVVGVGCNIYGGGFPPTFIPSFSWGGAEGFTAYLPEKLFETASKMYERRGLKFGDAEKQMLLHLHNSTL